MRRQVRHCDLPPHPNPLPRVGEGMPVLARRAGLNGAALVVHLVDRVAQFT